MNSLNTLYEGPESLASLIREGLLDARKRYLVRIYTASCDGPAAVAVAAEVKAALPHCSIIGATTLGFVLNDVHYDDGTMLIFESFSAAEFTVRSFKHEGVTPEDLASQVAAFAGDLSASLMHVLFSHEFTGAHGFVDRFNELNAKTVLVGGAAGFLFDKEIDSFVFDETGVKPHSLLCAALSGPGLKVKSWVNVPHEPVSEVFTVTHSDGPAILAVDGMHIVEWVAEYIGIKDLRQYTYYKDIVEKDELAHFPIILEGRSGASRLLYYDEARNAVCAYGNDVSAGTRFRIGYASPDSVAKNTYGICRDVHFQPIESLFYYSCFFRKLYFDNCTEWEMLPYGGNNLCGVFLNAEIGGIGGSNECLAVSSVLVAVAERRTFIRPDMSCFEKINAIEDKSRELLDYVLERQEKEAGGKSDDLLQSITLHQDHLKNALYYDSLTDLPNSLSYRRDFEVKRFNKICMIKIENSLTVMGHLTHEVYSDVLKRAVTFLVDYFAKSEFGGKFTPYSINDTTFIVASSDDVSVEEFRKFVEELFGLAHFFQVVDADVVFVTRFVVVADGESLLESAFAALRDPRYEQIPFLVYGEEAAENLVSGDEFVTLGILNRALATDGIVPYFQGIYSHELERIDRYEALMRIRDRDGSVYPPAKFLEVAKKYHLYGVLSMRMISQVLNLFKEREEIVSLNVSALDIESPTVQRLIFEKLAEIDDCSRIIFEVVESEYLSSFERISGFVERVRAAGAKIAVDDFGSGYSNFREIINIKPDYIKISGEIIKNILSDEPSRITVKTIILLAAHLKVDLVAEYVENEEIEACVRGYNVGYSQGFFFSLPASFEQTFGEGRR